jgi:gliding motility-associated-like protein
MEKKIYLLILTVLTCLSVIGQPAKCIDLGTGVELGGSDYGFIDFFKPAGEWVPMKYNGSVPSLIIDQNWYRVNTLDEFKIVNGSYWNWDRDWNGIVNNDSYGDGWADCQINYSDMMIDQDAVLSSGYPKSIPITIHKYKTKTVDPNQAIDPAQPITIGQYTRRIYLPTGIPLTGWILKWKGKGTITYDGITVSTCNVTFSGSGNVSFTSQSGGRAVVDYTPYVHGRVMNIIESDASDPIRDIVFLYPGMEALYDGGQRIHPSFIEKMAIFKTLRYMVYNSANGIKARTLVPEGHPYKITNMLKNLTWNERTKPDWYNTNNGNGGAHEFIVEASNLTKTDAWVNIPYCAGEDYVKNLVKFYMQNLDPDRTLYLELGNELWNYGGGFNGYHWLANTRPYNYPGLGDGEARGAAINDVFTWVKQAAGNNNMSRIVRVFGAFPEYEDVNNRTLLHVGQDNWDALATTFYFGLSQDNSSSNTCRTPGGKLWREELYDYFTANQSNLNQNAFNQKFKDCILGEYACSGSKAKGSDVRIAKSYNKQLVCYEGGNGTFYDCNNGPTNSNKILVGELNFNSPTYPAFLTDNAFINAVALADRSQETADIYIAILDSLRNAGFKLANHLSVAGNSSCFGLWSLYDSKDSGESLTYLKANYPKFNYFCDVIQNANCNKVYNMLGTITVGSGLSIKLDGFNDYLDADALTSKPSESGNYAIEGWIKSAYPDTLKYIFSLVNSSQPSNFNAVYVQADGRVIWEVSSGANRVKIFGNKIIKNKWNHIAVTKGGNRYTLYINGKNVGSTDATLVAFSPNKFSFGTWNTGSVNTYNWQGEIDEFRIWNNSRTEDEIRDYMCKKFKSGSIPSSLTGYYNFDIGNNSTTIPDISGGAAVTATNLTFGDRSNYVVSGAAIGDISQYRYEYDWNGISITSIHPDGDFIGVNNMGAGSPDGVQMYWVNNGAYYNDHQLYYESVGDNKYFGVFMANGTVPEYDITYMYQGNPKSGSGLDEDKNRLMKKTDASEEYWMHGGARIDKVSKTLSIRCRESERAEYNIGIRPDNRIVRPGSGKTIKYIIAHSDGKSGAVSSYFKEVTDYTATFWVRGIGDAFSMGRTVGEGGSDDVSISWDGQPSFGMRMVNNLGVQTVRTISYGDSTTWYHYSVVRKGSEVTMYINGNKTVKQDFPGTYGYKYNQVSLMAPPVWAGEANIQLDEFALWNVALDQNTIRDWMCKKITADHPNLCENLILYFNFDEGQGNVLEDKFGVSDMILTPGYFTYGNSGAAIGDVSVYNYTSTSSLSLTHPEGDKMLATLASGDPLGIHLYRINNLPPVSSNVNDGTILSMDSTRYWGIYVSNPMNVYSTYNITYNYQGNSTINTQNTLRLLQRYNNSATGWNNPPQVVDNSANTIKITGQQRGEYVLGGTTTTTFIFSPPAKPVFMPLSAIRNFTNVCGNSKALTYKLITNTAVVSYVWSVPSGLQGFSSADSIILNASYAGASPISVTLAGAAVNQFGISSWAYYIITINPSPTKADAGPDQFIIPPVSSALLDGNSTISGEVISWTVVTGTGSFSSSSIPKPSVTGLAIDKNILVYTISRLGGTCPANSDTVKITVAPRPKGIVLADGKPLPDKVCTGTTLWVKAIPPDGFTPDNYQWNLPIGMTLIAQSVNTAQIAIAGNSIGDSLKVSAVYNSIPSKPVSSAFLSIRAQPALPEFVNKPANICYQVGTKLSINDIPGIDSVQWDLPFGIYPVTYPKSTGTSIQVWAIISTSGFIKVRTFNDGCTSALAADSFYVNTKSAPIKPSVMLTTDGAADVACNDDGLYIITNPQPNTDYIWSWNVNIKLIEYFGDNHKSAHFDMSPYPEGINSNIFVYAKTNAAECNISEIFNVSVWGWNENGYIPDVISVTSPTGQDVTNLQIGQTYSFITSCTSCPNGPDDAFRWHSTYYWDAPLGATIIPDGNDFDNRVNVRIDSELSGSLRVWAITLQGCVKDASTLIIKTPNGLDTPMYISGNTNFCQGINFNISVTGVPNAIYYAWQLPDGTGTVITTTSPMFTSLANMGMAGDLLVSAHNGTVTSTITRIKVTVLSNTLAKPTFYDYMGNPTTLLAVCEGDYAKRLLVSDIHAGEYVWGIPGSVLQFTPRYGAYDLNGDGIIESNEQYLESPRTSGRDTIAVYEQVDWRTNANSFDGNFVLTSKNGCGGTGRIDSLHYYYAQNAIKQIPVFVEAPTTLCKGSSVTYRINEMKEASEYIWNLPPGLTATSIVTHIPQITVQVGSGSGGKVGVYIKTNVCGGGQTITQYTDNVTISGTPLDFKFLQAPAFGCIGQTLTYTVNDIGASKYTWNLPGGIKDVIVDDSDPSTVLQGSWNSPYSYASLVNGSLRVTENNDPDHKKAIYTLNAPRNGRYKVYSSYYVEWFNFSVVKIVIEHVNGSDTVIVNQKQSPSDGIWQYLGEYEFNSTIPCKVTVLTGSGGFMTMIDAFKLESLGIVGNTTMSFTVNGKESGSVCVTVPDAACPSGYTICTENVDLSGKLNPPVFISTIPGICQGQAGVSFNVANDPSVDFYNWSYSGSGVIIHGTSSGVTLDFAANATSGTLSVSGTNSCTQSKVSMMIVNVSVAGSVPVFAMGNSSFRCQGAGSVGYVATNTGLTRYMISPSSININTVTSAVSWNASFSGIATVTAYSLGCSAAFARHVVTVNSVPSVSLTGTSSVITLGASTGTITVVGFSGTVINWQVNYNSGAYTNISSATGLSYSVVPNAIGIWNYSAVLNGGLCANITTTGKSIQVTGTPGTVTGGSGPVCINATIGSLTLVGAIGNVSRWEYSSDNGASWSAIANTTTLLSSFVPLSVSGTYQFRASVSGVGYSFAQSIAVSPLPIAGTINVSITTVCGSGTTSSMLNLTSQTGTSITWEMNTGTGWNKIGSAINSYQINNLKQTANYRAQVGNGICANATTPSAVIMIQPATTLPIISVSYAKTLLCKEESANELATINGLGGSFSSSPSGLQLDANGNILVSNSQINTYQITYTLKDGACPDRTATATNIRINSKPVASSLSFLKTDFCNTETPLATFDGVGGKFSSTIAGLSIFPIPSTQIARISNAPNGNISIIYALSVVGCSASISTASTHISEEITLPVISYPTHVCVNTPIAPIESFTGLNLAFSSADIAVDNLGSGTPTVSGSYTITYTLTGNGACSSKTSEPISIEVTDSKAGTAILETALNICEGNIAAMNVAVDSKVYKWQQKVDNTWKTSDSISNTFTSDPLFATSYFRAFTVPSEGDVCGKSYSNVLTVTSTLFPKPGTTDSIAYTFCDNLRGELKLNNYFGTILWQESGKVDGPFIDLKSNKADVLPIQFTDYAQMKFVRAKITNTAICPSTFTGVITVTSCTKSDFVPNALTPNSSDLNSKWDLSGLKLLDIAEIKVFSRYGTQVYSASGKDVRENPWTGDNLAAGTYYYVIDRNDKKSKVQTGAVTIIK